MGNSLVSVFLTHSVVESEHDTRVGMRDTQAGGVYDVPHGQSRSVVNAL